MSSANPSIAALEAEIAASRERLARTVDELARQATPKAIANRQKANARARFAAATTTPSGEPRTDRIVALGAAGVVLIALGLWRRSRA
ncbi:MULTISPECIES: DUF3618 domain-containing protein [unclassified Janibacter]|uniref:DUF3618 domain-containing protein n=1 Tax=unclassified Janibacter TaxID=2649294 RepID=UPI003D032A5B